MSHAPNFELRAWNCFKFPVALWWRSVYTSSNLFSSRLHGVWRSVYIRSNLFCSRLHGVPLCCDGEMLGTSRIRICSDRIWKEGTAGWTRCGSFAFSSMLSDSSACSLHCMAPGLSKIFSQVKQKRTQNIQKYSQRARERDSFPNISYSTEISADRRCLNMKCGSSHDSWKFIFGEKEDQEIWKKKIQDSIDLKFAMQIM